MMKAGILILGLVATAGAAGAEQPVSERMADCAGLFRAAAGLATEAAQQERLIAVSESWLEASVEQARSEGAHYPDFYAISMQDAAVRDWESRGLQVALSEGTADWADDCRALGRDRGLGIHAG